MPFWKMLSPTEFLAIKRDNKKNCTPMTQVVSNNWRYLKQYEWRDRAIATNNNI